jgi:hypothetical protein
MMQVITFLAGLAILIGTLYGSYKSISYAQRNLSSLVHPRVALLATRLLLLTVGSLLGFLLATLSLRVSESHIIVGLPFPWGVWEYSNGQWLDFVGPFSLVLWAFDLIVGVALLHTLVVVANELRKRRLGRVNSRRAI